MNWDQQIWQLLVMNKSAVSVLLFALFHSRNPNKMVNIVLEQSLARIKNHIFLIAQSWDVKLKLMPYLSWFSAQFWKRSKFLLFVSAYHYQHIIDIFLFFYCQALSMVQSIQSYTRAALLSVLYWAYRPLSRSITGSCFHGKQDCVRHHADRRERTATWWAGHPDPD